MRKCKQKKSQPGVAELESNLRRQWRTREGEPQRERDGSKRGKVVDVAGVALKAGSRRNGWGRQLRK
jgi:hypothetical protein